MKIIFSSLLILIFILVSCSNNRLINLNNPNGKFKKELNYLGDHRTAEIVLKNNQSFLADNSKVINDSLYCLNVQSSQNMKIHVSEIKKISFKDHILGTGQGFFLGFGIGTAVGLITVDPDAEMAGLGILAGMVSGAIIGGIAGLIFGSNLNYIIESE